MKETLRNLILPLLILMVIGGGGWTIRNWAVEEWMQARQSWRQQLYLAADMQLARVADWVKGRRDSLALLAEDTSLRLYLTQYLQEASETPAPDAKPSEEGEGAALLTYLRIQLQAAAQHSGLNIQRTMLAGEARNLRAAGGIYLLDTNQKTVAASASAPAIPPALEEKLRAQAGWQKGVTYMGVWSIPLALEGAGDMANMAAFAAPVYAVQMASESEPPIGIILGLQPLGTELAAIVQAPISGLPDSTSFLIREEDDAIMWLTPPGGQGLPAPTPKSQQDLDAVVVLKTPLAFDFAKSQDGRSVRATGRPVEGTDWTLVQTMSEDKTLSLSKNRIRDVIMLLTAVIMFAVTLVLAAWRHAVALRSESKSRLYHRLSRKLLRQERLLKLIADHEPYPMALIDGNGLYRYVNRSMAERFHMRAEALEGKPLHQLLGVDQSALYRKKAEEARDMRAPITILQQFDGQNWQVSFTPIQQMPTGKDGTLITLQNVTELLSERDKREKTLDQLVETLVGLIDSRDKFAVNHSKAVTALSGHIAKEMGLDETGCKTVSMAGELMNLGKLFVPESILTSQSRLTPEQLEQVRQSLLKSAEVLQGISFNGPVAETVRQSQETLDGSGPLGLKDASIIQPARILVVANAFISMTSERAFRPPLTPKQALNDLIAGIDRLYDRRTVLALGNYLEKEGNAE